MTSNRMASKNQQQSAVFGSDDFISGLTDAEKQSLFAIGSFRHYKKDEIVFSAGSSCDDLFILLNGRTKVFELSQEGKEVILWFCFPGEIFGIADIMGRKKNTKRMVNAQACCALELVAINQSEFVDYLYQYPNVALRVIDLLSHRMRELGDMLLNLVSDDVSSRVVKLIMRLATRYGRTHGKGVCLDIPLTHQEMADMIGTSRQTVTMVLGNLKKEGLLKTQQRTIYIQDFLKFEHKVASLLDNSRNHKHQARITSQKSLQVCAGLS